MTPRSPGSLEVRLARSAAEIDAAQALRYSVFYDEMGALPDSRTASRRRDGDGFDAICDHLLVIDSGRRENLGVVGTYRLMRRSVAEQREGFYSAGEFDLTNLMQWPGEIMELGRSCVHADYRRGAILQLLWRGIADYARAHSVDILFGCASFHGRDPADMALALSYLHYFHRTPWVLCPKAQPDRHVAMDLLPEEAVDEREALKSLPPLIKGYLRAGGTVGDGAVVDHQFNTVDVCIVVRLDQVTERYSRRYQPRNSPTTFPRPTPQPDIYVEPAA